MATSGYFWVEGTKLHYIDSSGTERSREGTKSGATGQTAGYVWVEGDYIRYIDNSGDERYLPYSALTATGDSGYLWIEGDYIHYIREGQDHEDVSHSNTPHSNTPHSDSDHSDISTSSWDDHSNITHSDVLWQNKSDHSDVSHSDVAYSDVAYSDVAACFLAKTEIIMADNSVKNIENIKTGDKVLSFHKPKQIPSASVSEVFTHSSNHYYILKTEDQEVKVTQEHPFCTPNGFTKVKQLSVGDKVYISTNQKLVLEKILYKKLIRKQIKVYNFQVDKSHTYFANRFAVHNKPPEHSDIIHSDASHSDISSSDWTDYTDTPHSNVAASDWSDHSDVSHSDADYSDSAHSDTSHSDVDHSNTPAGAIEAKVT